ncbi:hypothetical protein [Allokutzneria albata]|uniref:Shikimate 5-dehydrogenase n=1 Tax=Allokutzneria albata TaxID=211114 RepID=A0A1G9SWL5_ALLAB|nr:hypothetical protein [Allokutzneria albata]SDM39774.1 Shikimate 5-dehydrogenase [Allokutzneria albata]
MTGEVLTVDDVESWTGAPLVLFVGVRTAGSLVHAVFDRWSDVLDRTWVLRGVDLPIDTPPATYRRLLTAMRGNPAVVGAVVTAHKLRLYRACADLFDQRDRLVELTQEINTVAAGSTVACYANDARSLVEILPSLGPIAGRDVVCFGAGGAATALLLALHSDGPRPSRVRFADVDPAALTQLEAMARRIGATPDLVRLTGRADADRLVAELSGPALVVNATGLGKDAPGSPISDQAPLGPATTAWDLNYRGDLTFLRQARDRDAPTVDGWDYFAAGWAAALAALASTEFTPALLARFTAAAEPFRPPTGAALR